MTASPLILGTVQLGGAYGVANKSGRPDLDTAVAMVEAALAGGITAFDTAAAYGDSEVVLGEALHRLGVAGDVLVVTKVRALAPYLLTDREQAAAAIIDSVAASRRRLRLDTLPVVLFHREVDAAHLDVLLGLRERRWIDRLGVSVGHDPASAGAWAARGGVQVMQVPASVLDRRHITGGTVATAAAHGVELHVRSAFLQGLLLMPEAEVPEFLAPAIPARRALGGLAAEAGLGLAELAVRYLLGLPGLIRLLVGADTVDQVRANAALAASGPLPADLAAAVEAAVPQLPELVVSPYLWAGRP